MRLFILTLLSLLFLTSCDYIKQETQKIEPATHLSDLIYYNRNNQKVIYKNNTLFTGTAWSSDGKFLNIIVENGTLKKSNIYNPNQTIAVSIDFSLRQYINGEPTNPTYTLYNENGAPLVMFGKRKSDIFNDQQFVWANIDTTSASYKTKGYWKDLEYPYENQKALIEKGEAVVSLELHKAD